MRVTVAQLNTTVGDVGGNLSRAHQVISQAAEAGSDLVVFTELFLSGYPPRDLLNRCRFVERVQAGAQELLESSRQYPDLGILVGLPTATGLTHGRGLRNSAYLIANGELIGVQHKSLLPTYDVFDEDRYFDPACERTPIPFKGERLGISICEDAWNDPELWPHQRMYDCDPIAELAAKGATLLVNLSASPYSVGKEEIRFRLISRHATRHGLPFVYVNQVGGNDELIFDGRSLCLDARGEPIAVLPGFEETVVTVDTGAPGQPGGYTPLEHIASVHDALVLGLRDYMRKCGFRTAVIGLSGGIDSSVVCCLAVAALGPENVMGMSMPSMYSSAGSVEDPRILAANLGIEFHVVPIAEIHGAYLTALQELFAGTEPGVAEENIQARIRGNLWMAVSNKRGSLALSCGNKSELAVGYCTLYGDMSGGLSVISDVPKTMVYELARYINRKGEIIPARCLTKAPSAELRPNQTDQDTLPPYEVLDGILQLYVEEELCAEDIVARGFDEGVVRWVTRTIDRNEYKRRQAAPGLRVTSKAFGVGRRMPVAAKFSQ
ncbi:MAG: NAD+ synthase [Armatimonadetes bacterium]|nr:NAD+ synthase [Armatimonadota bacterium]